MRILAGVISLTVVSMAFGAQPRQISLEETLRLLNKNNLQIRSQSLTLKQAELQANTAWNLLLPKISPSVGFAASDRLFADTDAYKNLQGSMPSDSNALSLGLGVNLDLAVGQVAPVWKSLLLERDVNSLNYRQLQRQLNSEVTKLFYNLLAMRDSLTQMRNSSALAKQQYSTVQQRYRNGLVSQVELLQSQVSYESTKPPLRQAETLYRQKIHSLLRLIGLSGETVELKGELTVPPATERMKNWQPNWQDMTRNRLDFRALDLKLQQNHQDYLRRSLGLALPNVRLGLSWNSTIPRAFESDTTSWDKDQFKDSLGASVSLGWELSGLIPGSGTNVGLQTNKIQREQLQLQIQQQEEQSQEDAIRFLEDIASYYDELEVNKLGLELAQRSFDLSNQSYQEGLRTLLDVDSARVKLLEAEQQLLNTKRDLLVSEQDLLFTLGLENRQQLVELLSR